MKSDREAAERAELASDMEYEVVILYLKLGFFMILKVVGSSTNCVVIAARSSSKRRSDVTSRPAWIK